MLNVDCSIAHFIDAFVACHQLWIVDQLYWLKKSEEILIV